MDMETAMRIAKSHFAATKATKPIDDDCDDDETSDDEEGEGEDDEALENADLLALKILELLRPELRRIEKMQNKQHRAISERLTKIEEGLSTGFFLTPNHMPEIDPPADHISKKLKGQSPSTEGCTPATANAPPPPLTIPTTKDDIPRTEPTGQQPSYADILQLSKPGTKETAIKKTPSRENNLSRMKRTITITRTSSERPPVDPLKLRNTLNGTLRNAQAPANAVISTVTLNQKNNYVLTTREDCPATTVLEYEETLQTALHEIDNATTAMKPQETWAKVTIHGINLGAYPDDAVGMTLLRAEIETHNPSASLTTLPRYITRPENRTGKQESSICVCVSSEALANQLVKKGVLIDCQRRKAERYWTARPSDQCRSCLGFGHHWKRCNTSPRCHLCGNNHKTGEHTCSLCPTSRGKRCPHTILRCANCEGDHRASDRTCPVIARLRDRRPTPDSTTTNTATTMTAPELASPATSQCDETMTDTIEAQHHHDTDIPVPAPARNPWRTCRRRRRG